MRITIVLGYLFSAFLYLRAWWNPKIPPGEGLIRWATVEKLALTEFLTVHASTMLGAAAFAAQASNSEEWDVAFWFMFSVYVAFGASQYLYHRNNQALLGFYLMLALRGSQLLSLRVPDPDIMRSQIIKNLLMSVPMMALFLAMPSGGFRRSRRMQRYYDDFETSLNRKPVLYAAAYYLVWAVVEWKWPLRLDL